MDNDITPFTSVSHVCVEPTHQVSRLEGQGIFCCFCGF